MLEKALLLVFIALALAVGASALGAAERRVFCDLGAAVSRSPVRCTP